MVGRIITTRACIDEGADCLVRVEPRFVHAIDLVGEIPLRRRDDGFASLLNAIVSQQVSVAAANGIWRNLAAAGFDREERIVAASTDDLRSVGLSKSKIKYAKALAEAQLDFAALRGLSDSEVIEKLTEIKGIGRWTAEIYCMFSLGRADAFAAGDLALQESAKLLFNMDKRPSDAELRSLAEPWSPWKSVAARILFAYYRHVKNREGIT